MTGFSTDSLARTTTLRQLQILVAVARFGGYTRAAEALHLTQPTVSMQVKKLSESIGLPLFEVSGKQLQLTPAGRKTLDASQDILNRLELLGGEISSLTGEVKGELRIAVVTTAKYFMPHLLGVFVHRYPDVEPRLFVTNREKILERLEEAQDDLLIMGKVPEELEVDATPFLDNDLVVIAPPGHRLAKKRAISLKQLLNERFLLREPGSGTRLAMDKLFKEEHLVLEPYMELGSIEAIKQAVMAGLGISVMSEHNLRLELDSGKISVLDVKGFPLRRHWFAVHASSRKLSLVAQTFLDFIRDEGSAILHD
ncbi:LysR family transcriptional regulator [Thiolapillus brandeum]|uniref:LysR family transcriptional regulator n=1 Tax=Thiolapillus brandeum TaxID=1076588 RepID=A0A7U6GJ34_9GAMM|nr:LysR family transcriptional regulator [Thiolapillus brandeum]BAO44569.1 LysR family transcriptional regulator [Thiolapillus brandeum]